MNAQPTLTTRQEAAIAAAAMLGPTSDETARAIADHRAFYAIKRAQRDRRVATRRSGRDRRDTGSLS